MTSALYNLFFNQNTKADFTWSYTDEPHLSRRLEILKKYPYIEKLYGPDSRQLWLMFSCVILQFITAYYIQDAPTWLMVLVAYFWGGTLNHSLSLAIHELSHNLMAKEPIHNTILGFIANLPIPFAYSVTFQKYHLLHHRNQGHIDGDPDLPTRFEGRFFSNPLLKTIFLALQPALYTLRPLFFQPVPITNLEIIQWVIQITIDILVIQFIGYQALIYLVLSTILGSSLHPMAGHFVAEHYEWIKGYETYSYYGPLNLLTYNVGYHNEHHDFPQIPGSRLPLLKKMVPEYYDNLPHHKSWIGVMWRFITDSSITPFSRVVRKSKTK